MPTPPPVSPNADMRHQASPASPAARTALAAACARWPPLVGGVRGAGGRWPAALVNASITDEGGS